MDAHTSTGGVGVKVISLFDLTGNMLKPWRDAGYECHLVDTQHQGDNVLRAIDRSKVVTGVAREVI